MAIFGRSTGSVEGNWAAESLTATIFTLPASATFTRLVFHSSQYTTSTCTAMIYDVDPTTQYPTTRRATSNQGSGNVVAGLNALTFASAVTLPAGTYAICMNVRVQSVLTTEAESTGTTYEIAWDYFTNGLPATFPAGATASTRSLPIYTTYDGGRIESSSMAGYAVLGYYTPPSGEINIQQAYGYALTEEGPPDYDDLGTMSSCMVDPYTGDLWWTLDGAGDTQSLFVARAADGHRVTLKPFQVTNSKAGTFGYELRLVSFRSDMVIVSYTDGGGDWDAEWGTYLLAFSKDFSTYGTDLRPNGRQKIIRQNDRLTPARDADGTLYLLCDVRVNSIETPTPPYGSAKVKLFTWEPPATLPNGVPVNGLPPLMTGTLTDITPTTGWATAVEAGVDSDPTRPLTPRLFYRAADHSLLIATGQTRPTLPLVTPWMTVTKPLSKTNFAKLSLDTGTVTALVRNDGRLDATYTPTEAADAPYVVVEWAATDFERSRHYSAPTASWTLVQVAEPAGGTYREGFNDGTDTPTHYLLEQRSLTDWSLLRRVDLRDVLADLPEAAGLSLDDLAMWRLGSGWSYDPPTSEHVYRLTWDILDHALYVRYGDGSAALNAGAMLQGNERLLKLTVMTCPPVWVTPAGSLADVEDGSPMTVSVLATDPQDQLVRYTVKFGTLPEGLSLDGATGVISGTPTLLPEDLVATFTLRASSEGGSADREFSIAIRHTTCVPVYDLGIVGTLPAAELAHAVADDGTAPYYESRPEFHVVNPATRTVLIPSMAEDDNGDYQMRIFTEHLDTGVRGVIDPFADWATKPDMSGQLIHFMMDPYTQDLWWTIYNRSDSHVYVARASQGYKVTLQPAVMADAGGYTTGYYWRLLGFTPTMVIFAFIDDMSVFDTTWGTYLTVFSKDFSQYGGANQTLTPSGRQKVVHMNDKVSPAFDKHGDLWLLADIRTNSNVNPKPYPGKLRLLRWTPPTLGPIPFGQAMPTLTGVLTDMTPATGWDTTVEVGVSTNPNQPDFPYLYYNEETDSLLVTVGQGNTSTSLSVPHVINNFSGGPYTQSYWQSNVVRYDIATATLTALTRHDGLLDANKLPVATVGEAAFVVIEWYTTDPHFSRSFQSGRADSTWIWTTYKTLVNGTVRSNFTDGTGSETIGFFERRSLADWSLLDRVDTRTTLNLLPEAGGQTVYSLMDPWTEGPWDSNQYVAENIWWITWLPEDKALLIRYDYGSVPLDDGMAYVDGHERLLKITLKTCPPI